MICYNKQLKKLRKILKLNFTMSTLEWGQGPVWPELAFPCGYVCCWWSLPSFSYCSNSRGCLDILNGVTSPIRKEGLIKQSASQYLQAMSKIPLLESHYLNYCPDLFNTPCALVCWDFTRYQSPSNLLHYIISVCSELKCSQKCTHRQREISMLWDYPTLGGPAEKQCVQVILLCSMFSDTICLNFCGGVIQ